ncbi:MAG: carboxypeptidase-like regulatory domain-containing protein [bacterium]|nr:carboxypeptidase-like regulatory domain-containing protein [bacterium]
MKGKIRSLTILIIGLGLICGCAKNGPFSPGAYTTGKIIGKVTNSSNGEPIKEASVSTSPGSWVVTTDDSGRYTIFNVDEGDYTVTAEKSGYRRNSVNIEVRIWRESVADIQLTPLYPPVCLPPEGAPEEPCP